ncbi:hypothetical protein CDAR_297841 [Caerostris darwini]|uniref:Uncharacterized protein n=1 Tax=Caerostris darwini TaxID=1538125 RepID=A0AAV4U7W3_9ARAC|nr:hypothetical protein CDAR_297841 [Caerostris darwini]
MNEACRRTVFVYCVIKSSSAVSQSRGQLVSGFLQLQPVVDRKYAWKHSPIVERMNSEGSPGREARCFEVKQPLADVTWSSKEGAGLTGMLTGTRQTKWMKVCLDERVYTLLSSKFVQIKGMNIY